nr:hypothetical protein CFP56_41412 [Quercus suber]
MSTSEGHILDQHYLYRRVGKRSGVPRTASECDCCMIQVDDFSIVVLFLPHPSDVEVEVMRRESVRPISKSNQGHSSGRSVTAVARAERSGRGYIDGWEHSNTLMEAFA